MINVVSQQTLCFVRVASISNCLCLTTQVVLIGFIAFPIQSVRSYTNDIMVIGSGCRLAGIASFDQNREADESPPPLTLISTPRKRIWTNRLVCVGEISGIQTQFKCFSLEYIILDIPQ